MERTAGRPPESWNTHFNKLLGRFLGKQQGNNLGQKYSSRFSPQYQNLIPPGFAVRDVLNMECLSKNQPEIFDFWKPFNSSLNAHCRLQYYSLEEKFLDELMPLLENLNLRIIDQIQFSIACSDQTIFLKSFSVKPATTETLPLTQLRSLLLDTLSALLSGKIENDALNGLLLLTGLSWREIDVFRGYRNYYFQLGNPFSLSRFHQALLNNHQAALLLYGYFEIRFRHDLYDNNLQQREEEGLFPARLELLTALEQVSDINEDRILRELFNLIDATVRTNFFIRQGQDDNFFAFKVSSLGVINMPTPRPLYEIYVHAGHMEGVHLRDSTVARGGIRWSDRPDDFRTEILGLMQTQVIKNALIVPQGAKGGFVVKAKYSTREEGRNFSRQAYMTFMRGLLDLTDNRVEDAVVHPRNLVTYDHKDPYLVVAADKGTAHLPDTANQIADEYRFWLADAFASGGSQGYDHKKLGITARGAWESVKQHFCGLGRNIQKQPFTVVGVGSMDGDVFGNGMLLSPCTCLIAAIASDHIFIDPNPDPKASFQERKRLFELPGSSWDDYDSTKISEGGGIFSRHAKNISLSPQICSWLNLRRQVTDGEGLVRLVLTARVDLLWLGGIGTYIKSSQEKNNDVGDRNNDSVRMDATQVQAQVVGEGANLGFTQKARIEYALLGGLINTDALDNSAGVDMSDHEVNLKILLRQVEKQSQEHDQNDSSRRLQQVVGEVSAMVLGNNYNQALCVSLDLERVHRDPEPFLYLADRLENAGLLDRASASFPLRKDVLERTHQILTRPELAILMSYSKMQLKQALLEQPDFLASEFLKQFLFRYFPKVLQERFPESILAHPLANEITATVLCNIVINQAGSGLLTWREEMNNESLSQVVTTYSIANEILDGENLRIKIQQMDHKIPSKQQYNLLLRLEDTLAFFCRWFLETGNCLPPEQSTVNIYKAYLSEYERHLERNLPETELQDLTILLQGGEFEYSQLRHLALIGELGHFPALVEITSASKESFQSVVELYEQIHEYLGIGKMLPLMEKLSISSPWQQKVNSSIRERFKANTAQLTLHLLQTSQTDLAVFFAKHLIRQRLSQYQRMHHEISITPSLNLLPFSVLSNALEGLVDVCVLVGAVRE